jgi:hypothetical protein
LAVGVAIVASALWAADNGKPAKINEYNPADATIEMFSAIEKGDITVKLVAKDSKQCNVLITNKTDKPLNIKLPEAFAGVPALAAVGGAGGGMYGSGGSGGGQSTGGGMGGMGGGFFNVAAEKMGKLTVTTVCLEHGKTEPREAIPYEIRPIESVTTKAGVRELCESLGTGQINQRAAQAAAWHLNNDMSWEKLAAKQLRFANGTRKPYFTQDEIRGAMQIATVAVAAARGRQQENQQPSPGETSGLTTSSTSESAVVN